MSDASFAPVRDIVGNRYGIQVSNIRSNVAPRLWREICESRELCGVAPGDGSNFPLDGGGPHSVS